jgi:hypothetical protein
LGVSLVIDSSFMCFVVPTVLLLKTHEDNEARNLGCIFGNSFCPFLRCASLLCVALKMMTEGRQIDKKVPRFAFNLDLYGTASTLLEQASELLPRLESCLWPAGWPGFASVTCGFGGIFSGIDIWNLECCLDATSRPDELVEIKCSSTSHRPLRPLNELAPIRHHRNSEWFVFDLTVVTFSVF